MNSADSPSTDQRPELIFALVGAAGSRLDDLSAPLKRELLSFGYKAVDIHLSDLLENFSGREDQTGTTEFDRIRHRQDMGNAFRKQLNRGDAMALAAIAEIRAERAKASKTGNPDQPVSSWAFILDQLKHPDEVDLLREVYGPSFLLIAGYSPKQRRIEDLARKMAKKEHKTHIDPFISSASEVIEIDEKQDDRHGQNVRDSYPKADFFVNLDDLDVPFKVQRLVRLLFGHPFHTPSPDEYLMYQANAISLRSSDANRQVGAVIVNIDDPLNSNNLRKADVIAVGMNEVPRGGGGPYWEGASPDARDQALEHINKEGDRAAEIKVSILTEVIEKIVQKKWLEEAASRKPVSELAGSLLEDLKGTQFLDIGEFSRPVHAEMAALIDAARRGVAVDGSSMYVTTFPCHNCAKHIIAAGIQRVVYLEPYPKSRATHLYDEEIYPKSQKGVRFVAFSGVAPRQYRRLFSMSKRGAKRGYPLPKWEAEKHSLWPPYVPQNASLLYHDAERRALQNLTPGIYSKPGIA